MPELSGRDNSGEAGNCPTRDRVSQKARQHWLDLEVTFLALRQGGPLRRVRRHLIPHSTGRV